MQAHLGIESYTSTCISVMGDTCTCTSCTLEYALTIHLDVYTRINCKQSLLLVNVCKPAFLLSCQSFTMGPAPLTREFSVDTLNCVTQVQVLGIDSSNLLTNHAMFGGQNGVIHGATCWFTVKKKGELIGALLRGKNKNIQRGSNSGCLTNRQ